MSWLRGDLAAWRTALDRYADKARPAVQRQPRHRQEDKDFAGVRGPEALARLPESERRDWQKLWADVADTLARAEGKAVPEKKSAPKSPPPPSRSRTRKTVARRVRFSRRVHLWR